MSQTKAQLISDLVQALNFTGTSSAPANGAFLSAANTLALATNSAQRLTIDSSGNVGIGTNSPASLLHVDGDVTIKDASPSILFDDDSGVPQSPDYRIQVNTGAFVINDEANNVVRFKIASSGNIGIGTTSPDTLLDVSSSDDAVIRIQSEGSDATDDARLEIKTTNGTFSIQNDRSLGTSGALTFAGNSTNYLVIDHANGNVGIGTASPSTKFEVQTAASERIQFLSNGSNEQPRIDLIRDSGTDYSIINAIAAYEIRKGSNLVYTYANDTHRFSIDGSEKARIDSSGRLGIGTTSPNTILDVRDGNGTGISSRSTSTQATDTNKGLKVRNNSDTDTFSVSYKGQGYFAGKLGIGTTSPGSELHVSALGASDEPTFKVSSENSTIFLRTAGSSGSFPTGGGGNDGELLYLGGDFRVGVGTASKNLIFFNGSGYTERMRIDSSGRVGIGTNSPDSPLHVHKGSAGTVSADGNAVLALENNNHCVLNIMTPADKSAYIMMGDPDDINAGQIRYDNNINELLIDVNGSERFRIDDSGKVGIGTSSPSAKLEVSARGDTEKGIRVIDPNSSEEAPYIEVIGNRGDGNSSQAFSGKLHLARNRSDQKVVVNNMLGAVAFGGNHTDGSESNILYAASIAAIAADSFDSSTDMPTDLIFMTGSTGRTPIAVNVTTGTERMRITHNGEVRIGNTGSIGQGTNGTMIPTVGIIKHSRAVGGGSATFQTFGNLGKFQTLGDGDAQNTNNSYAGLSDQNLKENIVDANSQWDDIKALKIRNYNFKESTKFSTHKQIGVIAQELETSGMNSLVKDNDEEGYKSVKYSVLYMKSIKALQEAMAKIETLETKVAALEAA